MAIAKKKTIGNMKLSILLSLMVVVVGAAAGMDNGLLFYASFDGNLEADVAVGEAKPKEVLTEEVEFVPGVKGMAARGSFRYPSANNISPDSGTIAFWARKVNWHANDGGVVIFFCTGHVTRHRKSASALRLYKYREVDPRRASEIWISNKLNVFAATGEEVDGEFISRARNGLPVDISGWQIGEWHHVALSWNGHSGMVRLYVDGFLVGNSRMPLPGYFSEAFTLGSRGSLIDFDEVRIYDRPLKLDEIRAILITDKAAAHAEQP